MSHAALFQLATTGVQHNHAEHQKTLIDLSHNVLFCFEITGLSRFIGCNHIRAVEFFTESFNSQCPFLAVQCKSYAEFLAGQCHCANSNCFQMGYRADRIAGAGAQGSGYMTSSALASVRRSPASTKAFLLTRDDQPFCRKPISFRYVVRCIASAVWMSNDYRFDTGSVWNRTRSIDKSRELNWKMTTETKN